LDQRFECIIHVSYVQSASFHFVAKITFGKEYKLRGSLLRKFINPPVPPFFTISTYFRQHLVYEDGPSSHTQKEKNYEDFLKIKT
jgi:hypothetical protein